MKYVRMCQMLTNQDMIVSCCTIVMYDEVRAWNRANNKRYVEVFWMFHLRYCVNESKRVCILLLRMAKKTCIIKGKRLRVM